MLRGLLVALGCVVLAELVAGWGAITVSPQGPVAKAEAPSAPAHAPTRARPAPSPASRKPPRTVRHDVAAGDGLLQLLSRHAVPETDLSRLLAASPQAVALRDLRPGQVLELTLDDEGLVAVALTGPRLGRLRFDRTERGYEVMAVPVPPATATLDSAPPRKAPPPPPAPAPRRETVRPGDSLFAIFQRSGQPVGELARLLRVTPGAAELKRLRPGEIIEFPHDSPGPRGDFSGFVYRPSEVRAVHYERNGTGYRRREIRREYERRPAEGSAIIESSLFAAADSAGIPDAVTMQLVEIFGWDVDFALDIRAGDRFVVLYNELLLDGRLVKPGAVLAAEFSNQGQVMRAVRYTDRSGRTDYFDPEGQRMRRAFIRTPVKFARISSGFSMRRRHPILHTIRAHRGVDYAAPRGTPVRVTGDGRVVEAGRKGGYGKAVVVQHGGVYTTLYGHLSRLARGIRRGATVRQGQTIGYVGSTGLATGPHLHYEFRINGVHRNPLTVKLPRAGALAKKERERFRTATGPVLAHLDSASRTHLASAQTE